MTRYRLVDNVKIQLTQDEETARDIEETKATEEIARIKAEIKAKEDLKSSARQKLMDGEPLTEDEAKTIVL